MMPNLNSLIQNFPIWPLGSPATPFLHGSYRDGSKFGGIACWNVVVESIIEHLKFGPLAATDHKPVWCKGLAVLCFAAFFKQSQF